MGSRDGGAYGSSSRRYLPGPNRQESSMVALSALFALQAIVVIEQPTPSMKDLSRTYSRASMFDGQTLDLKSDGTLSATFSSDVVLPDTPNPMRLRGTWTVGDGVMRVTFIGGKRKNRVAVQYIPVKWDKRVLLVPPNYKRSFVQFVKER